MLSQSLVNSRTVIDDEKLELTQTSKIILQACVEAIEEIYSLIKRANTYHFIVSNDAIQNDGVAFASMGWILGNDDSKVVSA